MFHHPGWAVGSHTSSHPAGGIVQILVNPTQPNCQTTRDTLYFWEMSSRIPPMSDDGAHALGAEPAVSEDDLNKMILDNDDEDDDGT